MKDLGSETEEEEPKQGCADTTCKWLFESEGCTWSSHVNSFSGLPLRGQKGHVCYPTRFSFLGLSTQLQVAVLVASIFSLSCLWSVARKSLQHEVMYSVPGATYSQSLTARRFKGWPFASIHAPDCPMGSDWSQSSAEVKSLFGSISFPGLPSSLPSL